MKNWKINTHILRDFLTKLSDELDVDTPWSQDWGIINCDGNRINEFMDFYKLKEQLFTVALQDILELIIASMNEAIIEGKSDNKLQERFINFIQEVKKNERRSDLFNLTLNYWNSLSSELDKFPVSKLLLNSIYED